MYDCETAEWWKGEREKKGGRKINRLRSGCNASREKMRKERKVGFREKLSEKDRIRKEKVMKCCQKKGKEREGQQRVGRSNKQCL